MKHILAVLFFFAINGFSTNRITTNMSTAVTDKKYSYLALGDSYTIGEMVPAAENFPGQVCKMLKEDKVNMDVRIIAKTGWTTDELEANINMANEGEPLHSSYDLVTLLIGVNNQYRGRSVDNYKPEFEALLMRAIRFSGNKPDHVIVLSIPDWGVTPFAGGRDRAQIATEIDHYNTANKQIAAQYEVHYIDITPWTREAPTDPSLLAGDGLHPSGKEYRRWAEKIVAFIKPKL